MSKTETLVIAAFPGTGKTFTTRQATKEDFPNGILDSDSSTFSWKQGKTLDGERERNPEFPNNYIQHIKENIGKVDIIFVSSHESVRKALEKEGIDYVLVFPNIHQKKEYIKRYKERGNSKSFIQTVSNNWDEWIGDCYEENYPFKVELPNFFSCKYLNKETIDLIKIMK